MEIRVKNLEDDFESLTGFDFPISSIGSFEYRGVVLRGSYGLHGRKLGVVLPVIICNEGPVILRFEIKSGNIAGNLVSYIQITRQYGSFLHRGRKACRIEIDKVALFRRYIEY